MLANVRFRLASLRRSLGFDCIDSLAAAMTHLKLGSMALEFDVSSFK
jgi:hypothetical protein